MGRARGNTAAAAAATRRGAGRPREWTAERLESELRAFIGDRADWPTSSEFVAAGRHDLREALKKHGGVQPWAARLGKRLRSGQDRTSYGRDRALADAHEVVSQVGRLPGEDLVRKLGYPRLATYMVRPGARADLRRQVDEKQ